MREVQEAGFWLGGIEECEFNDLLRLSAAGTGAFDAA